MGPAWFQLARRLIIFALGAAVIIDALTDKQYVVPELLIGMIMVGVLPLDDFAHLLRRNGRARHPPADPDTPPN